MVPHAFWFPKLWNLISLQRAWILELGCKLVSRLWKYTHWVPPQQSIHTRVRSLYAFGVVCPYVESKLSIDEVWEPMMSSNATQTSYWENTSSCLGHLAWLWHDWVAIDPLRFEEKLQTLPTKMFLTILMRFGGVKCLIVTCGILVVTWMVKPCMDIISWLPFGFAVASPWWVLWFLLAIYFSICRL